MIDKRSDMFVRSVTTPYGIPKADPYQHAGGSFNYNPKLCPDLFSASVGQQYCLAKCINTCPELDPTLGSVNATNREINATSLILDSLDAAVTTEDWALGNETVLAYVSGSVTYAIPATTTIDAVNSVISFIKSTVVSSFGRNMNVTCTGSQSALVCTFGAMIPSVTLPAFSVSTKAPYQFTPGLLFNLFNSIIQQKFSMIASQSQVNFLNATVNAANQAVVAIKVPTRFISSLGSPLPMSAIALAVNKTSGLPIENVLDVWSMNSPTAGASIFVVVYTPTAIITPAIVGSAFVDPFNIFTVTVAGVKNPIYISSNDSISPSLASLSEFIFPLF